MWGGVVKLAMPICLVVTLAAWALSRGAQVTGQSQSGDRMWRRLGLVSWVVGMTGILASSVLVYSPHLKYPEPITGSVYLYNLHGTGVYLNRSENLSLQLFEAMSLAGVLGGFAVGYISERRRWRASDQEGVSSKPDPDS